MTDEWEGNSMPTLFSPTTKTRTGEFNGKQMGVKPWVWLWLEKSLGEEINNTANQPLGFKGQETVKLCLNWTKVLNGLVLDFI